MTALPLAQAARELGCSPSTLRRHLAAGCPHVRGSRGRGHRALVDPADVRQWLGAGERAKIATELAGKLCDAIAEPIHAAFIAASDVNKRKLADVLAGAWYRCAWTITDQLRREGATIGDPRSTPEKIALLRKIANL